MKIKRLLILLPLLLISFVRADDCSITNLASCISQNFFNFFLNILNAPIQPLLDSAYTLLTQPVNISIFFDTWTAIVYLLSMFYGLFLMYAGFRFMVSGYSAEARENAKKTLTNIILMIVLVQASYYIYSLINDVSSSLTASIINSVQQNFFTIGVANWTNLGLEFIFLIPYLIAITITLIFLVIRYALVSIGVVIFAIGIFMYFLDFTNTYGKLLLNFLFTLMFIPFLYSIIILGAAMLMNSFDNSQILVMIGAFSFINLITILAIFFVVIKSAQSSPVMQVARMA